MIQNNQREHGNPRETHGESVDACILHDRFTARGGAENVAIEMARTLDAPIYAGAVNDDAIPADVEAVEVFDSGVGKRAMQSHYLIQDLYQMIGWQHVEEVYEHDVVVINKTNPAWFVPRDTQTTVWYVHSTPRGLYDQFHRDGQHWLTRLLKTPMRPLYLPNTRYADAWLCNSELVERRMQRYWDVDKSDVDVLYPPVPTVEFDATRDESEREGYLTVGRLAGHKRVDAIIKACNALEKPLTVAGDGDERERLEELAGPTVDVVGFVDEAEKRDLLAGAKAFLFAADNEDFGIAPIEAMASGTPVLGVADGFTEHQIIDGRNGLTWEHENEGGLVEAIREFEADGVQWSPGEIAEWASRFDASEFRAGLREAVEKAEQESRVRAAWEKEPRVRERERLHADGGSDRVE